jgi:hypothetical protein
MVRINTLCGGAFEPGHLAVSLFGQPILKWSRTCGHIGRREPAIVKSQFHCPLSDLFFHGLNQIAQSKGGAGLWPAAGHCWRDARATFSVRAFFKNGIRLWDVLDCGGKRSATPLWPSPGCPHKSAVAAALCQRSPKTAAGFTRLLLRAFDFENTTRIFHHRRDASSRN